MANYSYSKRDKSLGITWKKLHQYICQDPDLHLCCVPLNSRKAFIEKMYMRLPNSESDTPQKGVLYASTFAPSGNLESSSLNKYIKFVYEAEDSIQSRFERVRDLLIGKDEKDRKKRKVIENWTYKTHPEILAFKAIWEDVVPSSALAEYNETLEDILTGILNEIPLDNIPAQNLLINERLSALIDNYEYSFVLAIFSVIASTLFCFGCGNDSLSDDDSKLHAMVLPPVPKREESSDLVKARKFVADKAGSLDELYEKLSAPLKNKLEQGTAYYLLAQYAFEKSKDVTLSDADRWDAAHKLDKYLNSAIKHGNKTAIRLKNEKDAANLLSQAREIFNGADQSDQHTVETCCNNCLKVLNFSPAVNTKFCGEASYILYKYIKLGLFVSPTGETAQNYLDMSHSFGHPLAKDEWTAYNNFSIKPRFERPVTDKKGICFANAKNTISETFSKTIPELWKTKNGFISEYTIDSVTEKLYDDDYLRFLFIDDEERKNLQDFFTLMQLIKEAAPESVDNYEIFLRHDFEKAKPLVDTALNHLSDYQIAVYILDDDKQAAQQLLSCHPLFYPLKSINFKVLSEQVKQENEQIKSGAPDTEFKKPILNFIILGNTHVAEWLVREAFWMMGFKNNLIENQITILADNGESFEDSIVSKYPGMAKKVLKIKGIDFPTIKGINVDYNSPELYQEINNLLSLTKYNYFAVATESDEENLSLAMKVRELLIRSYVSNKKSEELMISPPVAFLCRDDNLSWVSKELVVEEEAEGDRWFNTWNLIPFGEVSKRYSFNNITGGTFEELARCIHYQYNGISPNGINEQPDKWEKATRDYYLRQYNQDSSYSSALSMPYRIFQFQDRLGNQVIPSAWSICQTTVFSSVNQLKDLSKRLWGFSHESIIEKQKQEIAEWEHARWVKWMVSRGWMPADIEEVVFAIEHGNPRQQLFVAKLHPCICSYDDLKILQNALLTRCSMTKDFFTNDLLNIQDTPKLLDLEWIYSTPKKGEKDL